MASPDPHTIRWLVTFLQELNSSVEESQRSVEEGTSEGNRLRRLLNAIQMQRDKIATNRIIHDHMLQGQKELIRALEHNLERYRNTPTVVCSDLAPISPPPRPQTPWPSELMLSQTSSESTFNASIDSQCFTSGVGKEQSQKRVDEAGSESSPKKPRLA
ncbi:hypothetical protein V8C42DRAFT_222679 [Trichoderma barbatum]